MRRKSRRRSGSLRSSATTNPASNSETSLWRGLKGGGAGEATPASAPATFGVTSASSDTGVARAGAGAGSGVRIGAAPAESLAATDSSEPSGGVVSSLPMVGRGVRKSGASLAGPP